MRTRAARRRAGRGFLSPVVRRLVSEHRLDPAGIAGTGAGGRVTRDDVLERVGDVERIPFTSVRKRTAEHMVRSKASAAHAAVVTEVDYSAVDRVRHRHGLSYLPFVVRAVVDALADFPHLNAEVRGDDLIVHDVVNIGVAVDLDHEGLIVPVVRDTAARRLRAIARAVHDLASRARARHLTPDDVSGGTFTITNPGPYGTFLSVPVINQPQVAILATDRVVRRLVAVEASGGDALAVRPIGHLVLSFDHRANDLAYAAAFLARVRDIVETRPWDVEL